MFDAEGDIKLIDFGFAVQPRDKQKCKLDKVGTPYYIAPEVFTGEYGFKCDIWSLGVLLYRILVGEYPFNGKSLEEIRQNIKSEEL